MNYPRNPVYVLLIYGGVTPGQRPRTKLALLTCINPDGGVYAKVIRANGATVKTERHYPAGEVVAIWEREPTASQLRQAREALPVQEPTS